MPPLPRLVGASASVHLSRPLIWNPNPTLDVVSSLHCLRPGDVHGADTQSVSAGGKGTLVVRAATTLGVSCVGVAPLAGPVGAVVGDLFKSENLPFITSEVSGNTRVAVSIAEACLERDTVVNGPGPVADDELWQRHIRVVARLLESREYDFFVVAGRPPLGAGNSDVLSLIDIAARCGVRVVCDVASPVLEAVLPRGPWLLKINRHEAQMAVGHPAIDLVQALVDLGAQNVVLTDGPRQIEGRLGGHDLLMEPPQVKVRSAVGCGDCFLAGLLAGLLYGSAGLELVGRAVAVASAAAETLQPGYFLVSRVQELWEELAVAGQVEG